MTHETKKKGCTEHLSGVINDGIKEITNDEGGSKVEKNTGSNNCDIRNEQKLPIKSQVINNVDEDTSSCCQVQVNPTLRQKCSKIRHVDSFSTLLSDEEFKKEELENLDGVSSIAVRNMTRRERRLVLYKRRLRNRISAKRSREKRMKILSELDEQSTKGFEQVLKNIEEAMKLANSNEKLFESVQIMNETKNNSTSD